MCAKHVRGRGKGTWGGAAFLPSTAFWATAIAMSAVYWLVGGAIWLYFPDAGCSAAAPGGPLLTAGEKAGCARAFCLPAGPLKPPLDGGCPPDGCTYKASQAALRTEKPN